jgi:hypothetical protein
MRFFRTRARPAGSQNAMQRSNEPSEHRSEQPAAASAEQAPTIDERPGPEPAPAPEPDVTPGPELEPETEPDRETPAEPAPSETPPAQPPVAAYTSRSLDVPQQWNLWELERIAQAQGGADPARDEERSLLLMYLRDFAAADGVLPTSFDRIVRESFGDVLDAVHA